MPEIYIFSQYTIMIRGRRIIIIYMSELITMIDIDSIKTFTITLVESFHCENNKVVEN